MITQAEADNLNAMEKKIKNSEKFLEFPAPGDFIEINLLSLDEALKFIIDINRKGSIRLKYAYQERYRGSIILVRLDISGSPHTNPEVDSVPLDYLESINGKKIDCPHLHVYVENYDDKWAIPVPVDKFPKLQNLEDTLNDFFRFCNVVEFPIIQGRLF